MSNRISTLILYKRIIYAARRFPSIKRDKIVQEIREGFRSNKGLLEGEDKYRSSMSIAMKGLAQLEQYSNLPKKSSNWSVTLEENPLPDNRPPPEEKKIA